MWKPVQQGTPSIAANHEQESSSTFAPATEPVVRHVNQVAIQATISKGLIFTGEVTGTESLVIDGKVEGSINLPGSLVSVGPNGKVAANISARDVVVMGKVRGNIAATDRVEVRVEGSLTGDVTTARISIEDGAYFKGGIDIRKSERKGEFRSGPAGQADAPRLVTP
jgi:cytoskeletal protein CcmA (bactofilin family)